MTVGMKIRGGFLIGACITVLIGGLGLYGTLIPTKSLDDLGFRRVPLMDLLHSFNYQRTLIGSYLQEITASQNDFNRIKRLQTIKTEKDEALEAVDRIWADFTRLPQVTENQEQYQDIFNAYTAWRQDYCTIPDQYLEGLIKTPDGPELAGLYGEYIDAIHKADRYSYLFYASLITVLNQNRQELNRVILRNNWTATRITIITLIGMIGGFAGALMLGFIVSRLVTRPLKQAFVLLKAIAEGDLTQEARYRRSGRDELGQMMRLLNQTQEGIKSLALAIQDKAQSLSGIGVELSDMMTQSAHAVHLMSTNTQRMREKSIHQGSALTEMNGTMGQIVGNINVLNANIEKQAGSISRSSTAIEEMLVNIASVTQSLMKNEQNVQDLASASEKGREGLHRVITDIKTVAAESDRLLEINKVIQSIASKTNLLAMNAAIEAAHAGDVGRGFAVVSDEIRKLAESSSAQAKTVSSVLKEIKNSLDRINASTETVSRHFEAINTGVQTVSELETQIRNAMEEQDVGSKEILETIGVSNEFTANVRSGSAKMLTGSQEIIGTGKGLETVTVDLTGSVNEIAAGMDQLNTTISRVQEMSRENKESIEVLMEEISRFKLQ